MPGRRMWNANCRGSQTRLTQHARRWPGCRPKRPVQVLPGCKAARSDHPRSRDWLHRCRNHNARDPKSSQGLPLSGHWHPRAAPRAPRAPRAPGQPMSAGLESTSTPVSRSPGRTRSHGTASRFLYWEPIPGPATFSLDLHRSLDSFPPPSAGRLFYRDRYSFFWVFFLFILILRWHFRLVLSRQLYAPLSALFSVASSLQESLNFAYHITLQEHYPHTIHQHA